MSGDISDKCEGCYWHLEAREAAKDPPEVFKDSPSTNYVALKISRTRTERRALEEETEVQEWPLNSLLKLCPKDKAYLGILYIASKSQLLCHVSWEGLLFDSSLLSL